VDIAIMHVESLEDIKYAIEDAKRMGVRVYLAMRPQTGIDGVLPYLREVDGILEMTADPGTYCTEFLVDTLDKVKQLRGVDKSIPIEVDGCMNPKNAKLAKEAGANLFVSGSHIFKSPNVDVALKELEDAIK
jgi:ribulose-phosphate 3-epimerase